jgi:hypothetical protein
MILTHPSSAWRGTCCAVLLFASTTASLPLAAATVELISRQLLFGNPTRGTLQLSPDGSLLAFLAPHDGRNEPLGLPRRKLDEAKPLTAEQTRPIRSFFWSRNGANILYLQDSGGDEDFLLYAVNAQTGALRKLTDFPKTRVVVYGTSWEPSRRNRHRAQ